MSSRPIEQQPIDQLAEQLADIYRWEQEMRDKGYEINEEEADRLGREGAGAMFACPSVEVGGFIKPRDQSKGVVIITENGYFARSWEDFESEGLFSWPVDRAPEGALPSN